MIKLSVVIITLNEEKNIARCLDSVKWADEIIIVDSGSTDKTKEICSEYNCKFIQTNWLGFGSTKRFAVNKASNDWILSIDADEQITTQLREEIIDLLKSEPPIKAYRIKRNSFYLGKMIRFSGWNRDYTLRLFNKNYANFNEKPVHEFVETKEDICLLRHYIFHYTYPDINSHYFKMKKYGDINAEYLLTKGKRSTLGSAVIRGWLKFVKMYILQLGFLDGTNGFLLAYNSAWGIYYKYLRLWEMNK